MTHILGVSGIERLRLITRFLLNFDQPCATENICMETDWIVFWNSETILADFRLYSEKVLNFRISKNFFDHVISHEY